MAINIELKRTAEKDLNTFFTFQLNEEANYLAAFTSKNPGNKIAYLQKWTKLLINSTINIRTIYWQNRITGNIAKYKSEG